MQYPFLPENIAGASNIPYLGYDRYDGGDFRGYPARKNFPTLLGSPYLGDTSGVLQDPSRAAAFCKSSLAFMQAWLFFGLLSEAVAIAQASDAEIADGQLASLTQKAVGPIYDKFLSADGQYIDASGLFAFVDTHWLKVLLGESVKDLEKKATRLAQSLSTARHVLQLTSRHCDKDHWIFMLLTFELLSYPTIRATYKNESIKMKIMYGSIWESITPEWGKRVVHGDLNDIAQLKDSEVVQKREKWMNERYERMLEYGWCKSDISRLEERTMWMQTRHFLTFMRKPNPVIGSHPGCVKMKEPVNTDESEATQECVEKECTICKGWSTLPSIVTNKVCTVTNCEAYTTDPDNYPIRHNEEGCNCPRIGPDENEVIAALNGGDQCLPLLEFSGDSKESLRIKVTKSSESSRYIALSHVWADGLGNPNENTLPSCQLFRLAQFMREAHGNSYTEAGETEPPTFLWLDTLCCPAKQGPEKTKAINRLQIVYQLANTVLVLDHGLQQYPIMDWRDKDFGQEDWKHKIPQFLESCLRICHCGWMRRLWTLQEAALAKPEAVSFRFQDGAISIAEIINKLERVRYVTCAYEGVIQDIILHLIGGLQFRHNESLDSLTSRVRSLQKELAYRAVSCPDDEPLCIANLLDIPLDELTKIKCDSEDESVDVCGSCKLEYGLRRHEHMLAVRKERMKKLWELLSNSPKWRGIPTSFVFANHKVRCDDKGWRWAPLSFLTPVEAPLKSRIENEIAIAGSGLATLVAGRGLRVKYPGFRFNTFDEYVLRRWKALAENIEWITSASRMVPEEYQRLEFCDNKGRWYSLERSEPMSEGVNMREVAEGFIEKNLWEEIKYLVEVEHKKLAVIIYNDLVRQGQAAHEALYLSTDAVLVSIDKSPASDHETTTGLEVSIEDRVRVIRASPEAELGHSMFAEILSELAHNKVVDDILSSNLAADDELERAFNRKALELVNKACEENPNLQTALEASWGSWIKNEKARFIVCLSCAFYKMTAQFLGDGQVWYVT